MTPTQLPKGEAACGAAKGFKDSVMITLGTGLGGGIIIDNKVYSGFNHGRCGTRPRRHRVKRASPAPAAEKAVGRLTARPPALSI